MNELQKNIFNKAQVVLPNPDYIIDIFKLKIVYVKPSVAKLSGISENRFYDRPIYEVLGYSFKDMLNILITRIKTGERELKINNTDSKIDLVKVEFKNFVFDRSPYRVGKIIEIKMKE